MTLVVDASVALRWYLKVPGSDAALAILDGDEPLIAPDLVVPEVCNAAWRLVRADEISEEHGKRIASAVASAFSGLVAAPPLASRAFGLARSLDHSVYDCLYLALAEIEKAQVVTTDRRLISKVAGTEAERLVRPLDTTE